MAFDASGSLFIADTGNSRVRKVDASGIITTLAGNGSAGFSVDGGPASAAELSRPQVLAPGPSGAWSSPTRATTGSGRWTPPWRHAEGN